MSINLYVYYIVGLSAGNNGGQNGTHCPQRKPIQYKLVNNIVMNNTVACR